MSHGGRGSTALLLSLLLASCLEMPVAPPPAPAAPTSTVTLAREAATHLLRIAAYDFALAGHFAGENAAVVRPNRYAVAVSEEARALAAFNGRVLQAAFAGGPSPELLALADASAALSREIDLFAIAQDEGSFAAVASSADKAIAALRALAPTVASDPHVIAALARASTWTVEVRRDPSFAVILVPEGEILSTHSQREPAERHASEVRGQGRAATVIERPLLAFSRSGPAPYPELWREPIIDVLTSDTTRRGVLVRGGFALAQANGELIGYDDQGKLRYRVRGPSGASLAVASDDGGAMLIAGSVATVFGSDGSARNSARFPSAVTSAVWFERRHSFIVASPGATEELEGGPGIVAAMGLDGLGAGAPFPLIAPAEGAAVAASSARDEIYVASTSYGFADVEVFRLGEVSRPRVPARPTGDVLDLAVDPLGNFGVVVTTDGAFRFQPSVPNGGKVERIGDAPRAVAYGRDGLLYVLRQNRLAALDPELREVWTAELKDGRRLLLGKRVVVQDGLSRARLFDPLTGAADELTSLGDISDVAISNDGARVLLVIEAQRAVVFALP